MKIYCQRTGIQLMDSPASFIGISVASVHPIFLLRKEALLEIIRSQFPEESIFGMNEEQQKLMMLGLLNSLNLIEFHPNCLAMPENLNLIPNLEKLVWIAEKDSKYFNAKELPKIAISEEIDLMEGLQGFLESVMEELAGIRSSPNEIQESILNRIHLLSKAVAQGAYDKEKSLRSSVAAWALESTRFAFKEERVSKEIQVYWRELLKSSVADLAERAEAKERITADLAELDDFLVTYLPHGSTASFEVLKHLEELKKAVGSLGSYLFGSKARSRSDGNSEPDEFDSIPFKPKSPMPVKGAFKSMKDWLDALKEWNKEARSQATEIEVLPATQELTDLLSPVDAIYYDEALLDLSGFFLQGELK